MMYVEVIATLIVSAAVSWALVSECQNRAYRRRITKLLDNEQKHEKEYKRLTEDFQQYRKLVSNTVSDLIVR